MDQPTLIQPFNKILSNVSLDSKRWLMLNEKAISVKKSAMFSSFAL